MKRVIYLSDFYEAIKTVDEFFGICIPAISNWILNYETNPDEEKDAQYILSERIPWESIGQLFIHHHIVPESDWGEASRCNMALGKHVLW